jgi:hypothetical protein
MQTELFALPALDANWCAAITGKRIDKNPHLPAETRREGVER